MKAAVENAAPRRNWRRVSAVSVGLAFVCMSRDCRRRHEKARYSKAGVNAKAPGGKVARDREMERGPAGRNSDRKMEDRKMNRHPIFLSSMFLSALPVISDLGLRLSGFPHSLWSWARRAPASRPAVPDYPRACGAAPAP